MLNIVNVNVTNIGEMENEIRLLMEGVSNVSVVLMYVKGCESCILLKDSLLQILKENAEDKKFNLYFVDADINDVFNSTLFELDGDKVPMINIFKDGILKAWSYGYRTEEQLDKLIGLYLT